MAESSDPHLPEEEDDGEVGVEEIETFGSGPYWSNHFDNDDIYASDLDPFSPRFSEFIPSDHSVHAQIAVDGDDIDEPEAGIRIVGGDGSDTDSISDVNCFNREDQVNFIMDLVERRIEQSRGVEDIGSRSNLYAGIINDSGFRAFEGNDEMRANDLELGLGFGLDFDANGLEDDDDGGFMIPECGGEFVVGRRGSVSESGESSNRDGVESYGEGLRVVGIDSDSDEDNGVMGIDFQSGDDNDEDEDDLNRAQNDMNFPLRWDCLHLEDHRDANEDFEWEEVDGRVDEREVLSMVIDADGQRSVSSEGGDEREETAPNLEWEVLLTVNNLERNAVLEHESGFYLADHDDYIYTAEYDMVFGQFTENQSALKGSPPAAKSIVENLPFVILTQEDVQKESALCAVCKDEIAVDEKVNQLPCSHRYHGDCIVPWLSIRNTCPVCRYELPTDDPDYEQSKTQSLISLDS